MKLARKISTILCDDIRQETGNKISLMGIYQTRIIFKEVPATLPRLCLYVLLEGLKANIPKTTVTLKSPKSDPLSFPVEPPANQVLGSNLVIVFGVSPFIAKDTGEARIEMRFGEEERPSIIHRFKIETTVMPTKS